MNRGMTLMELLVVVAVLMVTAALVIPKTESTLDSAQTTTTTTTLNTVRDAIMGRDNLPGYLGDMNALPAKINDLFNKPSAAKAFDINTRCGWHGPYLHSSGAHYTIDAGRNFTSDYCYVNNIDAAVPDAWNNPIVIQNPADIESARLVSAGPNGVLDILPTTSTSSLLSSSPSDDVWIPLFRSRR